MANKIDSNVTGLAFAEEASLKTLPGSPSWYELEPNSYSDFGGELTNVARAPIDPSRQRKKGTTTDLDASGGFNSDLTQNNLTRLLQGFFFADAREKPSTAPFNGTAVALTALTTSAFQAASGLDVFLVGHLIKASKMGDSANNGLAKVTAVLATSVTVSKVLVAEAAPPAASFIEACGFEFPTGDLDVVASASSIKLVSTTTDFTTLGLNVGEWIFVGGDATINQFANNSPGYARIKSISTNELALDDTTFTAISETGTGLEVRIFFGKVLRNEKTTALIKRRSYNVERQLGQDDDGVQSEYLEGAIANEFTLNVPQADKLNADLTFVAMDNTQRTGAQGLKAGTRVAAPAEDAFNTSSDIYRIKLNIVDPVTLNPTALFGYVSEANVAINNNVSANKAIGTLGAFDATAGDFEVSGSVTAYFSTVAAVQAVRNNSDVAMNLIAAQRNAAVVFDMPLIALGGGRLSVEKDAPITIPVDTNAAECEAGYTLLASFLPYVPSVGMPA
ncbi:MAG: hypothetical protein CMH23_07055 [Methylophaga sp.]|uniref:phage tail tube protein n=1 Tax=Methylophaga sp. TaxID=2024840 RepID=UPI000C892CED|nr:phage tail tube protein [Methylophaga sp.]MBN46216.1 hypothetical protein [Methylophaga sp.]QDP56585.1 MAG: hypothetical protein GOVbin2380_20 [Prokaryotic dsDNA virus sp.]|tara:strand:- start:18534 stop:20051 length:1518 start_codon:yes stop_codon:yes gene_type:complete